MAQNENISLSLANKVDILNKSQSVDARYGVYDTESDALDAMLAYGADGRQVAVYTDKPNGKVRLYLYNEVLHQLEPISGGDIEAIDVSFDDTTTQLGVSNTQKAIEKTNERLNFPFEVINSSEDEEQHWMSIAFGDGKFVAVAQNGDKRVKLSYDGKNWLSVEAPLVSFQGIAYGNGLFVAVANDDLEDSIKIFVSETGFDWRGVLSTSVRFRGVNYANGIFIAYSSDNPANPIFRSENGYDWTTHNVPSDYNRSSRGAAFGIINGIETWLIASDASYNAERPYNGMVSYDNGLTWESYMMPTYPNGDRLNWNKIIYADGKFVATASGSTHKAGLFWTSDLVTWNDASPEGQDMLIESIAYGNGRFLIEGWSLASLGNPGWGRVYESFDLDNWKLIYEHPNRIASRAMTFGNGVFVSVYGTFASGNFPMGDKTSYYGRQENISVTNKNRTFGNQRFSGNITIDKIKADEGEEFVVTVDEDGKLKSEAKSAIFDVTNINLFIQYNDSSVLGDSGTNLIQPDLGLSMLEIDDLQENSSYSGELVLNIENNNTTTAKVIELFGGEIYNNTNPSADITAKVTFTLNFFNQVGDDVDYKLSWEYLSSGEILFGQHTGTIDSTEPKLFKLLVTGHEDDVFTLKSAYLNRVTNFEERLLSTKTFKLGSEIQSAIYNNIELGNKIPEFNTIKAIDEFISNLKTAGIWSKIDMFSLFQMNDNTLADFALYDYKRGAFMTAYGGMIYDEFGYQGNGIDGYIDTEFNPSTSGVNYTLNDASRLFWLSKNPTGAGQSYVDVSSDTPNSGNRNYFRIHGGTLRMFINQGTTILSGGDVNSLGLGFKAINRTSSTDVAVFNGTTKNARTATSSEINNAKQLLFTSTNGYSDMGLGFYAMGASLTDQDVADIIEFYNEYLTEIGL